MSSIDAREVSEASSQPKPMVAGHRRSHDEQALGTFYANSAFLPSLEKEFGWTRAQTSLVTTFGIVMIASWFVVGGRL